MNYNDVKRAFNRCPDLMGLDEVSRAWLFWRATELDLSPGATIYVEGTALDNTFCLLLSGELSVEQGGKLTAKVSGQQIVGELAFFTRTHNRTATIRAGPPGTAVLKFQVTPEELGSPSFSNVNQYLGLEAWDRFVSDSKSNP